MPCMQTVKKKTNEKRNEKNSISIDQRLHATTLRCVRRRLTFKKSIQFRLAIISFVSCAHYISDSLHSDDSVCHKNTLHIRRIVFGPVESNMQPVTHEPTSIDFIQCEKVRVTMTTNVYLHLGMRSSELPEYSAFISRRKWSKVRILNSIVNNLDFYISFHFSHRAIDSQEIRTQ